MKPNQHYNYKAVLKWTQNPTLSEGLWCLRNTEAVALENTLFIRNERKQRRKI